MTDRRSSTRGRAAAIVGLAGALGLVALGGVVWSQRPKGHTEPPARALPRRAAPAATTGPRHRDDRWTLPVRGEPVGVAVDGGDAAVLGFREVQLVDGATGRARWTTELGDPSDDPPALGGTRVAVTTETAVVLLDRATGSLAGSVPFRGSGPVGFARAGDGHDVVVAGSTDTGDVLGIDATTATPRWSVRHSGEVWTAPQGVGDVAVVSWEERGGTTISALDAGSGAARWEIRTGAVASAPLVAGDAIVFVDGATPDGARARAVDARTGRERWSTPLPGRYDPGLQPGSDGAVVYVLDGSGTLSALDVTTGALRWRSESGLEPVPGRVAVVDGTAMFTTLTNHLVFVDTATGEAGVGSPTGVVNDIDAMGPWVLFSVRLGRPSGVEAAILRNWMP